MNKPKTLHGHHTFIALEANSLMLSSDDTSFINNLLPIVHPPSDNMVFRWAFLDFRLLNRGYLQSKKRESPLYKYHIGCRVIFYIDIQQRRYQGG
jgi:hypothetical protein